MSTTQEATPLSQLLSEIDREDAPKTNGQEALKQIIDERKAAAVLAAKIRLRELIARNEELVSDIRRLRSAEAGIKAALALTKEALEKAVVEGLTEGEYVEYVDKCRKAVPSTVIRIGMY